MKEEALAKELDKEIDAINTFVQAILEKNDISFNKLVEILRQKRGEKTTVKVPCCIFKERSLGILEALTKYMKEDLDLKYKEIASLLNRDNRVIWMTYSNARKKLKKRLVVDKKTIWTSYSRAKKKSNE